MTRDRINRGKLDMSMLAIYVVWGLCNQNTIYGNSLVRWQISLVVANKYF